MTTTIIPSTGINNCGGRCPLLIHLENGYPVKITGNPAFPDRQPCIKCISAIDTFLSKDRLLYPMKRVGKRGDGKFVRISWKEAIDTITREWIRIRDTYGAESRYVHYAWGVSACMSGLRLAKRLLNLDGGFVDYYNSYSTACCAYTTPYMYGTAESGSSYDTLMQSKLIILWGHNPQETRFDNLMYWLKKAREKDIPIIVIDPRRSATVKSLQAKWISIRPGTDAALMDALAYMIYTENLYDHTFVNECCQGFTRDSMPEDRDRSDCYFDYLLGTKDGRKKDPFWAEKITGVSAKEIIELARLYATKKPAALIQGFGAQRHTNGEQFTRGGIMLACLTGNVGIEGGWASGAGYVKFVKEPVISEGTNPVKKIIPVYEWTNETAKGHFKMILNLAGNALINQHGDINYTKHILEDENLCEFLVCSDIFMTPSAKFADILLPGVSMFEMNNLTSPWGQGDFISCVNQVIDPIGECRRDYDWLKEVADGLGLYDVFTEGHDTAEEWLAYIYETYRMKESAVFHLDKDHAMPPYESFKKNGFYRFPGFEGIVGFKNRIFPTPSGKVEIYTPVLADMENEKIPGIPMYVEENEGYGKCRKYPLQLIGWHPINRTHSIHDNNKKLQKHFVQQLMIHPEDAADRGFKDGEWAEVYNRRGKIKVPVCISEDIKEGCVALSTGAWYLEDQEGNDVSGSINTLTTLEASPLAHGNGQHTCLVEVRRKEIGNFCNGKGEHNGR